jgi:FtsP/CotA-like multicopper oxidase with cupredoxin domain
MKLVLSDTADVPAQDAHHRDHHHDQAHDSGDGLEWEDLMPEINAQTDASNIIWRLVDLETGAENTAIDWTFTVGDRVKIRLVNTNRPAPWMSNGMMHRMIAVHDIVLEVTEPGLWMAHCHIAEHNQDGMMFSLRVDPT